MSRRRRFKQLPEPARCRCEPGGDAAREHGRPGAKAADHGNPFARTGGCIHSELQHATAPIAKRATVKRLRLQ